MAALATLAMRCSPSATALHAPLKQGGAVCGPRRTVRRPRSASTVTAYTGWILDAPGCVPFREVEQTATGDRRVTRRALRVVDETKIAEIYPNLPVRLESSSPVDISDTMHELRCASVVVGDKHSYQAFVEASPADKPPPLVGNVSEWTHETGLAEFSIDVLGNLYVEDLPGPHELKVDKAGVGKGKKVRLYPGWVIDLHGKGGELQFEVWRDTHAHA
jgi:hypothetical protein